MIGSNGKSCLHGFDMSITSPLADVNQEKVEQGHHWSLNDFEIGEPLGQGEFGCVYKEHEKESKFVVAIKAVSKSQVTEARCEHLLRHEYKMQSNLCHPNILRIYGYFEDDETVYLILEYCVGGNLYKNLMVARKFDEEKSARMIVQLVDALKYCHAKHIIHQDIHIKNFLLGESDNIKLANFGRSILEPSSHRTTGDTSDDKSIRNYDFIPPEYVEQQHYLEKADIWSIGALLYTLLSGYVPFESITEERTYERITAVDLEFPFWFQEDACDLISKILSRNPADRISLEEIEQHPWFQRALTATEHGSGPHPL